MATGESKMSNWNTVEDIQDGDKVPILRDGSNYMSGGLAKLNSDLTVEYESLTPNEVEDFTWGSTVQARAFRYGQLIVLSFNVQGTLTASYTWVEIFTLPEKYRPSVDDVTQSFSTQEGENYVLEVTTGGAVQLYSTSPLTTSQFVLSQNVCYMTLN